MNKHKRLAAALMLGAASAFAQPVATTAKDVHLRAGPSRDFPVVAILGAGVRVAVEGCLPDYRWCDVVAGSSRGWVYAANIVHPYQGRQVPILGFGAVLGLGIVGFSVGSYWDRYYPADPWYAQRRLWIDRWLMPPPPGPRLMPDSRHRPGEGNRPGEGRRPPPAGTPRPSPGLQPRPPGADRPRDGHPQPPGDGRGDHRPPRADGPGTGPRPDRGERVPRDRAAP